MPSQTLSLGARPTAAITYYNREAMLKCELSECEVTHLTAPAAAAALPASSSEYDTVPDGVDAVCSGTSKAVGSLIGFLADDVKAAATGAPYIIRAPKILVPCGTDTPTAGTLMYRIDATGIFDTSSSSATLCGVAIEDYVTNPDGLPAGNYVLISFDGRGL